MKYKFSFYGRKIGGIGIKSKYVKLIEDENKNKALLLLYDTYEHLSDVNIDEVP